jgi:protein-S-isoprenylcysteine O-methyltransferase Ste14
MDTRLHRLQRLEFEARIFVSFALVALVLFLAYGLLPPAPPLAASGLVALHVEPQTAAGAAFVLAALVLAAATMLRMWAGSVLTPRRVMAFKVQHDALATRGPYRLSRNPIYAADLLAFAGFALCLPPVGLALLPLLAAHYQQIIRELRITGAGVRHNALYLLFLPGLVVAAFTGEMLHAILIGLPGTLDWAVVHTRIGLARPAAARGAPHA